MEYHKKALEGLCRLCARKATNRKQRNPAKDCMTDKSKIYDFYGITIENSSLAHQKYCQKCYRRIINSKNPNARSNVDSDQKEIQIIQRINQIWKVHSDDSCIVCELFKIQSTIGNHSKQINHIFDNLPRVCKDQPKPELLDNPKSTFTDLQRDSPPVEKAVSTCNPGPSTWSSPVHTPK